MSTELINWIKAILRRAWGKSVQRHGALKAARVSFGRYKCAGCKLIHPKKEIQVDHIIPVGRFNGFDGFIERLFCPQSGLAVLCLGCHKAKTGIDMKEMTLKKIGSKIKKPKKVKAKSKK